MLLVSLEKLNTNLNLLLLLLDAAVVLVLGVVQLIMCFLHVLFVLETIKSGLLLTLVYLLHDFPEVPSLLLPLIFHFMPHLLMKLVSMFIDISFEIVLFLLNLQH